MVGKRIKGWGRGLEGRERRKRRRGVMWTMWKREEGE